MKTSLTPLYLLRMSVLQYYTSVLLFNFGYFRINVVFEHCIFPDTPEFEIHQKNVYIFIFETLCQIYSWTMELFFINRFN